MKGLNSVAGTSTKKYLLANFVKGLREGVLEDEGITGDGGDALPATGMTRGEF